MNTIYGYDVDFLSRLNKIAFLFYTVLKKSVDNLSLH